MAVSNKTKTNYINTNDQSVKNVINQAASILSGGNLDSYIPGQDINTSYWATSTGGGKNALHGNADKNYKATAWTTADYLKAQEVVNNYNAEQKALADAAAKTEADRRNREIYDMVTGIFGQQQAQQQAQLQQAQALNANQINSAYDQSARDYYRLYKTQQKTLPENLSKAGVTGGASESSQLKLMNAYSDNLYRNESGRNAQLSGNAATYNDKVAQNSMAVANQMANAYLQMAQQQYAYEQQEAIRQREAQEARQLELEKAMIAATTPKTTKTGTTGGTAPKPPKKDPDENAAASNVLADYTRQATGIMYGNSTYATRTDGASDTLAYIERLLNNKQISENQALALIAKFGLD
jgi:hypothetical protein